MFEETISKKAKDTLAILGKSNLLKDSYLAGGTALALQLGHRISLDFDFFSKKKFNKDIFLQKISSLPINFELDRTEEGTILGYVNKTKFSLFFYSYPLLSSLKSFSGIKLADIKDITPMKIAAISDRGTKRDFIDLYFIIKIQKLYSLKEALMLYDKKFALLKANKFHIIKSLSYFEDANKDKMPRMIKDIKWKEVKKFFENEIRKLNLI